MTNDSDEVRKMRQEASAVRRLLATRKEEALVLRSQVEGLTSTYAEVEAGKDVDSRRLSGYGVVLAEPASPLDRLVAKSKIGGMIAERAEALRRADAEVMRLGTALGQLSTCPNCNGAGTKRRSEYERDDSRIQARQVVDDCSLCKGNGTIDLD